MELKKLKIGTTYATCDGQPVIVKGLEKSWVEIIGTDPKTGKRTVTVKKAEPEAVDPWGGCMRSAARYGSRRLPTTPGILCETFKYDRNGDPVNDDRKQMVVQPRDIKGTWKEFLVLHGERIRERADYSIWEQERYKHYEVFQKAIAKALPGVHVTGYLTDYYGGRAGHPTPNAFSGMDIRITANSPAHAKALLAIFEKLGVVDADLIEIAGLVKNGRR